MIITKEQILNLLECTTIASSSAPMSYVGSKPFPIQEDVKELKSFYPKHTKKITMPHDPTMKPLDFSK